MFDPTNLYIHPDHNTIRDLHLCCDAGIVIPYGAPSKLDDLMTSLRVLLDRM